MFTHTLEWSELNMCWWVTTRKDGEPHSGMPVSDFESKYPDGVCY